MVRKAISIEAVRTLFSKTGNQCAFPGCTHPLVDDDNDFVAQICHIEAASPGGQRFNPKMSDELRRDPSNLLILCHRHHVKTDDETIYTVEVLKKMKAEHEAKWSERDFQTPDEVVERIVEQELTYIRDLEVTNAQWRSSFDLAMEFKFDCGPLECLEEISVGFEWFRNLLSELTEFAYRLPETVKQMLVGLGYDPEKFDSMPYIESPIHRVHWEALNLGVPNFSGRIEFNIRMLEVMLLFRLLRENPADHDIVGRLDTAKAKLEDLAGQLGYAD